VVDTDIVAIELLAHYKSNTADLAIMKGSVKADLARAVHNMAVYSVQSWHSYWLVDSLDWATAAVAVIQMEVDVQVYDSAAVDSQMEDSLQSAEFDFLIVGSVVELVLASACPS